MIFRVLLILKRTYFVVKSLTSYFKSSIYWLFTSREHTSFSIVMSNKNTRMLAFQLSSFLAIDYSNVITIIKETRNISFKNLEAKKSIKFSDIDLLPKFDYRLLTLLIHFISNTPNIIELGFNQGRLAYLLNEFLRNKNSSVKYIGIDFNKRKGGLLDEINNKSFQFIYGDIVENLPLISTDELNNSILVATTHEKNSEEFIFKFLYENNIYPKFIISDNVEEDSNYIKFLNNSKNYSTNLFLFEDENNFIKDFYIGVSKKLT